MSDQPRWEVEGRAWPNREHSHFVDTGPILWHVQLMGQEDAPVLLMLHGTGGATHSWRALAPLLATRFRVVAPDLPGHGFTRGRPPGGLSMPAMARAVADLIDRLEHRAALIAGHSAGAAVALRMVVDERSSPLGVIGMGAALLPFPGIGAALFPALSRLLFLNPVAPQLFARVGRTSSETARFLQRSTGSRIDAEGIACYRSLFASPGHCAGALAMMSAWDLGALRRDLARLSVPLLLLHGSQDAAIPLSQARTASAMVPGAELRSLAGLGHLAHEERPEDIASHIIAFGERIAAWT